MAAAVAGVNGQAGAWRDMASAGPVTQPHGSSSSSSSSSKNALFRRAARQLPRLLVHSDHHALQRYTVRQVPASQGLGSVLCLDSSGSDKAQEQGRPDREPENGAVGSSDVWRGEAEFEVRQGKSTTRVRAREWEQTRVQGGEVEQIRVKREDVTSSSWKEDGNGWAISSEEEVWLRDRVDSHKCVSSADGRVLGTVDDATEKESVSRLEQVFHEDSVQVQETCRTRSVKSKLESSWSTMVRQPASPPRVAQRWREVQGAREWQGMLDPMHPALRAELVRYGEFAQACYDAFDGNTTSRYCGSCKFDQDKMLEAVGLPNTGYRITKYIYATSQDLHLPNFFKRPDVREDAWSKDSNWVGFVAVCTSEGEIARLGRRDILVAWRGTATSLEWKENLRDYLTPMEASPGSQKRSMPLLRGPITGKEIPSPLKVDVKVEHGFYHMYSSNNPDSRYNKSSAKQQVLDEVRRLVDDYDSEQLSITITGHSLGGALSILSAHDICEQEINRYLYPPVGAKAEDGLRIPVTVFNFAAPRVGNEAFRQRLEKELGVKVLRVVNDKDTVPRLPGFFTNEKFPLLCSFFDWLPWTYSHVGVELQLSSRHSTCLDHSKSDMVANHSMELYLHLLDAFKSAQEPFGNFSTVTSRDLALLNKHSDILDKTYRVPPCWWQERNKGLVFDKFKQRWRQKERDPDDIPVNLDRHHRQPTKARGRDADDIPVNIDRHSHLGPR